MLCSLADNYNIYALANRASTHQKGNEFFNVTNVNSCNPFMIHPDTELRFVSPIVGYGVFATSFIPKGTIVYVKDSLEIEVSPHLYSTYPVSIQQAIEKYSYIDERGYRIISWDHAKYVNHCCNFNTISTGYGFEIAVRDIQPGEQITDEYAIFNMINEIPLSCSENCCRKVVKAADFDANYKTWDKMILSALETFHKVQQPLESLVDEHTKAELEEYLSHKSEYKSVYTLKYHNQNGVYHEAITNGAATM